jgi:hypothetical protein
MTNIGTLVMIKLGTTLLVGESSTSFKSAQTMIEVSNKALGNAASFKAARITQTISVSSLAGTDPAATNYGVKQALDAQVALTSVAFIITEYTAANGTTPATGALKLTGNCLLSNVSVEYPDNDKITMSLDLQVTDGTTVGTN